MSLSCRLGFSLCAFALCLLFNGCESSSHQPKYDDGAAGVRPVSLRGDATCFNSTVHAVVTISRGRPMPPGEEGSEHRGGRRHGGGGHGRRHGGGGGGDMDAMSRSSDDDGEASAPRVHPMQMPALTLRLKLENTSKDPEDVLIHDFNSDLGNFVVNPEHLRLAPGQALEVDPMVSQLGALADELPVIVVLRLNGKTESQVVVVNATEPTEAK